jgi:hypothetical protein
MRLLLALIVLMQGACVSTPSINSSRLGPYSADYETIMAAYVRDAYFDPHTLRDVAISAPDPGRIGSVQGWAVCVRANGKNRMGAYAGRQTTMCIINHGAVVASLEGASACDAKIFAPWPEMENTDSQGL